MQLILSTWYISERDWNTDWFKNLNIADKDTFGKGL